MRPQVFVVEGKNDAARLKQIYNDIEVIITNGSAISIDSITMLEKLNDTYDIILFLDPDHAGDRIRRILGNKIKNVYHAFIDRDLSVSSNGKKVGVEHASEIDIKQALSHIHMIKRDIESDISHSFLYDIGLTGQENSQVVRKILSSRLHIGYVNGKTLYHRLRMFGINQKDVIEVLK
jgi:ribonuclease M5